MSASVVGVIAAFTTQQAIYAVVPLSVSAVLSLIARQQRSRQLDKIIQNEAKKAQDLASLAHQAEQRLSEVEQQGLNYQEEIEKLTQAVAQQNSAEAETFTQLVETLRADISRQTQKLAVVEGELNRISIALQTIQTGLGEQGQASLAAKDESDQVRLEVANLTAALAQSRAQIDTALANIRDDFNTLSSQTVAATDRQTDQIRKAQQRANDEKATVAERISQLELRLETSSELSELSIVIESLRTRIEAIALQLSNQTDDGLDSTETKTANTDVEPDFSHVVPQLPTDDNFDLDINLGIDFGTGYTKVCLRDLALEQAEVVTFTGLTDSALDLDETLMPTRLAILEDGTLLTGLTVTEWRACNRPIQQNIDYIKMRLAAIDLNKENSDEAQAEWRLEKIAELDDDETVKSLCAYYLSQVIARSQQWAIQNRPEIFANRTVRWSVNLGVPVEYCDSKALKTFEQVLAIAWLIKSSDIDTSALTISSLNRLTKHLEKWAQTEEQINQLDCTTTPEIVAAMWSFINSRQAQEGFYTFFDIGDGTLDGAAFIFNRTDGSRKVDCYIGKVEPLGVSAFVEKTADELQLAPESVRHFLSDPSNSPHSEQLQNSRTRNKIQSMVAEVVMDGNEKHQQIRQFSVEKDIGENLKVFIGGGGGNTEFFPDTIEATHSEFKQGNADIPPYKLRQIPTPQDLVVNGLDEKDFNRFAIAYGLCIPEGENPEIRLPSQFQTIESGAEISEHTPERYEDSRDLM
ncbi:hypothetical protein S7335_3342 [Synechococcus sp. PCC 7335]|uniref:hypothetical protein n=1 Tax=Synechococcus sp. (strain ATCC 29403 / PCC 7335) TaxID=91464 RepID=UPI00017ECAFD|nr:hypothetical protein [Synechococcus sp. PCC 7335]EDX85639.1 hypothetical protein S7335_3342 [Synechococcus sp. PCC 7335]